MTNNQTIKLLDATLVPEEAKSILLDLINSKINFLNRDAFSKHIRFSQDINHAETRTAELRQAINNLLPLLDTASDQNYEIRVKGSIDLELVHKAGHTNES